MVSAHERNEHDAAGGSYPGTAGWVAVHRSHPHLVEQDQGSRPGRNRHKRRRWEIVRKSWMDDPGEVGGVDREDSPSDGGCTAAVVGRTGLPEQSRGCRTSWAATVRRTWRWCLSSDEYQRRMCKEGSEVRMALNVLFEIRYQAATLLKRMDMASGGQPAEL